MPPPDTGHLSVNGASLESRMIGPRPDAAPTIVMLHEGLGSVTTWGEFPAKLAERTGAGVFVYSRAGYGKSSSITLPRPLDYMQREATDVLPALLDATGFRRGILLGHSDGATAVPRLRLVSDAGASQTLNTSAGSQGSWTDTKG